MQWRFDIVPRKKEADLMLSENKAQYYVVGRNGHGKTTFGQTLADLTGGGRRTVYVGASEESFFPMASILRKIATALGVKEEDAVMDRLEELEGDILENEETGNTTELMAVLKDAASPIIGAVNGTP